MNKRLTLSSLSVLLLLSACSSSDSDDDSPVTPPEKNTFSLQSVITNNCGGESPYTDIELILQDEDWEVISRHLPNSEGIIEFETEQDQITYTLVATTDRDDEDEGLEAVSFYQVNTDQKTVYYATNESLQDNSGCECKNIDITVSHPRVNELVDAKSSADFTSFEAIDGTSTLFNQVIFCHQIADEWPMHSFMVQGPTSTTDMIATAGFGDGQENEILAVEVGANIQLSSKNPEFVTNQLFNGLTHFEMSVAEEEGSVLIFDNHEYSADTVYHSNASIVFEEYSTLFGKVSSSSTQSVYSTGYLNALDIEASDEEPNVDLERLTELQEDGQYDYSSESRHEMAIFNFVYRAKDPTTQLDMPVNWKVYAPNEGQLPIVYGLPGYEDIIDKDTSIQGTFVSLVRSYETSDYQDYVDYYASETFEQRETMTDKFVEERHMYDISIELK